MNTQLKLFEPPHLLDKTVAYWEEAARRSMTQKTKNIQSISIKDYLAQNGIKLL